MDASMQKLLEEMLNSPDVPAEVRNAVMAAMADPEKLDEALAQLQAFGADQVGSGTPLNIADYYVPRPGKYEQRWKLGANLPVPFAELDHKTQFFVLFQEWSRRELEGMMLLNKGDLKGATAVFEECLERARQIEVKELMARSYEGLMRVAQREGNARQERNWLSKAAEARRT